MSAAAAAAAAFAAFLRPPSPPPLAGVTIPTPKTLALRPHPRPTSKRVPPLFVSASSSASGGLSDGGGSEVVFFDGGAHYGDLVINLLLGITLLWLPLTLAAVSRAFFLRYRFTSRRVTVVSGLAGQDRSDFPYASVSGVQAVPRLVGAWGDIVITLKDGTKVDLRSVPRFREVADYCRAMADAVATTDKKR